MSYGREHLFYSLLGTSPGIFTGKGLSEPRQNAHGGDALSMAIPHLQTKDTCQKRDLQSAALSWMDNDAPLAAPVLLQTVSTTGFPFGKMLPLHMKTHGLNYKWTGLLSISCSPCPSVPDHFISLNSSISTWSEEFKTGHIWNRYMYMYN